MSKLQNKIEAHDRSISEVLDDQKYMVDYFQREFKWGEKHIEQLISDLSSAFLHEYNPIHKRKQVAEYNTYYMGPFVVSVNDDKRSIIDGQQRLTSLTLLLIYLNHLQKEAGLKEKIETLIFSEKYGEKSFNIQVDERTKCLEDLFTQGHYKSLEDDDESTQNMADRYLDIVNNFPEEIKTEALPYFIDWLKYNVVLVEIIAYSDENAYTIFETMNDRGLNLSPTEMLKGFILSKFNDRSKRHRANEFWKKSMQELHEFDKDEDLRFFQAWLRGQYAESIRPGKAGSKNEDFEKIGTRFHSWVRDNLDKLDLNHFENGVYEEFIDVNFKFFLVAYKRILNAELTYTEKLSHVYYIKRWGIANSLSFPLLLAPLTLNDSEEDILLKINLVARFIETYVVRRSVNFRKFASSSIRYTMYTLVKEIRNKTTEELKEILVRKLSEMEETMEGVLNFRLHGQNYTFVKFLLSRMTSFVETETGMSSSFDKYYYNTNGKPFEVEHIWQDIFEDFRDEFDQLSEFQDFRNKVGGLLLLPRGTNQSFGKLPYVKKLPHYRRENLLAQTLCESTYQNNPNLRSMMVNHDIPLKAHEEFKKQDLNDRQELYKRICEEIWSLESFTD
jgi:uncharacterized protein with ParB-like and HNH nuclease domain